MNRRERRRWLRAVRASGTAPEAVRVAQELARAADRDGVVRLRDDETGEIAEEVCVSWPR